MEEPEEEEDKYLYLTDNELMFQACGLLLIGTLVCTVVSDLMVDIISTVGLRLNISLAIYLLK
jgi:hypothetical protein